MEYKLYTIKGEVVCEPNSVIETHREQATGNITGIGLYFSL